MKYRCCGEGQVQEAADVARMGRERSHQSWDEAILTKASFIHFPSVFFISFGLRDILIQHAHLKSFSKGTNQYSVHSLCKWSCTFLGRHRVLMVNCFFMIN